MKGATMYDKQKFTSFLEYKAYVEDPANNLTKIPKSDTYDLEEKVNSVYFDPHFIPMMWFDFWKYNSGEIFIVRGAVTSEVEKINVLGVLVQRARTPALHVGNEVSITSDSTKKEIDLDDKLGKEKK